MFATRRQLSARTSCRAVTRQKLILAREIDQDASLIIAAQPTRGLDVGATAFVWRSLREARARGSAILVISSDLDELFDISDRLVVFLSGRLVGEFRPPYRLNEVGAAMIGAR
jgi:simple sugar transport system ATP-binding protein